MAQEVRLRETTPPAHTPQPGAVQSQYAHPAPCKCTLGARIAYALACLLPDLTPSTAHAAAQARGVRSRLHRSSDAMCVQSGIIPKLDAILEDSDAEEEPDAIVVVPHKKVKLVVGPGGEKIKYIQQKSKCRLQVSLLLLSEPGPAVLLPALGVDDAGMPACTQSTGSHVWTRLHVQYSFS